MRLGFAGTPQFAVPALEALTRSRHRIAGVFTQPDRPSGRGLTLHVSPIKQRATELGLPVYQPANFRTADAAATLAGLELDALVVVAYGMILPAAALAIPRLGCFNIHASLLPRWRGAAPIQRALLAGDERTGVTIMRMEPTLDTGPLLAVRATAVTPRDTAGALHDRLALLGADLLVETLDVLAGGTVPEQPQPPSGITYAEKISKAEALIDWRAAAAHVERQIRAFNPWPVAETSWDGVQLRVWEAELEPGARTAAAPGTVIAESDQGIDVACGGAALRLLRLQLAGRKPLPAREFRRARRLAGASFGTS